MRPTIQLHGVEKLTLSPVQHFPAVEGRTEFWTRDLIVTGEQADTFRLPLFSRCPHGLLTDDELIQLKRSCRTNAPCGVCAYCKTGKPPEQPRSCEHCPTDGGGCSVCGSSAEADVLRGLSL